MNLKAKRALVALGIAVPLGVFWAAREAASWRPVKVGYEPIGWNVVYSTELRDDIFHPTPVRSPDNLAEQEELDVLSPELFGETLVNPGADGKQIIVTLRNRNLHQIVPEYTTKNVDENNDASSVYADSSRVLLIGKFHAWVWDLKSRRLLHQWKMKLSEEGDTSITSTAYIPHTRMIMQAMGPQIRMWSAQTGQLVGTSTHPLANFNSEPGEGSSASIVSFSPNGKFCFYDTLTPTYNVGPSHIALCQSGQTLWKLASNYTLSFGGDDKTVLAQWTPTPIVEVRDIQNGQLLRKLKIRPGCTFIGSSPDGNTLYTHNGAGEVFASDFAKRALLQLRVRNE